MLHLSILNESKRILLLPTRIQSLTVDPLEHKRLAEKAVEEYGGKNFNFESVYILF